MSPKTTLRQDLVQKRWAYIHSLSPLTRQNAAKRLASNIASYLVENEKMIIAGYWPLEDEIDSVPTLKFLHDKGHLIVLPCIESSSKVLTFREWNPEKSLEKKEPFGIYQPGEEITSFIPDILLVPLLAFDLHGTRLGRGVGYYDSTLAALRSRKTILAIGVAYEKQKVEEIPKESHDQPLDLIITEEKIHSF
jgi:5-formyltetrahydrofolate cyclo-ligase